MLTSSSGQGQAGTLDAVTIPAFMAAMAPILSNLESVIRSRMSADPGTSYVASLFAKGRAKIAQKVGEEAVETVIAAIGGDARAVRSEAADLIFHLAILLADQGLSFDDVLAELDQREGTSGLAEKASRSKS